MERGLVTSHQLALALISIRGGFTIVSQLSKDGLSVLILKASYSPQRPRICISPTKSTLSPFPRSIEALIPSYRGGFTGSWRTTLGAG